MWRPLLHLNAACSCCGFLLLSNVACHELVDKLLVGQQLVDQQMVDHMLIG